MGCQTCSGTGYIGRSAIVEVLPVSDPIRQFILQRKEMNEFQQITARAGMRTMQSHGIAKALAGTTTVEEVLRVSRAAVQ